MRTTCFLGASLLIVLLGCTGTKPLDLGVAQGRLMSCPKSPNCVSSQATDEGHRMEPFRYDTSMEAARERLLNVLHSMPRTTIVESRDHYIHVECTTRIFRFTDDVEFYFNEPDKRIDFRSASRVGYSDFGANRKRMEEIRRRFEDES